MLATGGAYSLRYFQRIGLAKSGAAMRHPEDDIVTSEEKFVKHKMSLLKSSTPECGCVIQGSGKNRKRLISFF